jgi:tetratricopeptide (TPR) repeat protein
MLEAHNKREKEHLISLISRRSNSTPNFALIIGAGASVTSGIKPASKMIEEWRKQLFEESRSDEPFEEWLKKQDCYEDEEEYSILFEEVCDERSQRRVYIENCVKDAKPSWGYIYLANIIAHNYFNVIFTPNFDDLLNEACFTYPGLKPIVCAHDSAVVDIRVTSARPKIIKLHGDYLYDSIQNTIRETENLRDNMRDKFKQFAAEYGLVVVGYGGNDRSIMDILDMMSREEGYLPGGLYWCVRSLSKGGKISRKLGRLLRQDRVYLVQIEGFDEFMAELHDGLGLTLPDRVLDPFKATKENLSILIPAKENLDHPIINADIETLEQKLREFEDIISGEKRDEESQKFIPFKLMGDLEFNKHDYESALNYYENAIGFETDLRPIFEKMANSYLFIGNLKKAEESANKWIQVAPDDYLGYDTLGNILGYQGSYDAAIDALRAALRRTSTVSLERHFVYAALSNVKLLSGDWEGALLAAENALRVFPTEGPALINKCIALKELGQVKEANDILINDLLERTSDHYLRSGAFGILEDKANAIEELRLAIEEDKRYRALAALDPDFKYLREDSDFLKLVGKI